MQDHPADSQYRLAIGIVIAVHRDTWEVDVRLTDETAAIVPRCKVQGHYLPEVHNVDADGNALKLGGRQSKVVVGWLDASCQNPVAIPVHNVIVPDSEKANHVYWSEQLRARITINRQNEFEIRIADGDNLYQFQIQRADGIIRAKTPTTMVELNDAAKSITARCDGDLIAECKNAKVTAASDVDVEAGGNIELKAPNVKIVGALQVVGNVAVTGNLNATGSIVDVAGNTPHHSHG